MGQIIKSRVFMSVSLGVCLQISTKLRSTTAILMKFCTMVQGP